MAAVSASIRLVGADGVVRTVTNLAILNRERELLEGVGFRAVRGAQRGIREQRSPDGTPYPATKRYGRNAKRLQDTKRLLSSINFEITGPSRVTFGTNVIYAAIQHYGGTIVPKKAKKLAIPLTRQVAKAVAGRGFRAAFPDAFTFTSSNGNLLLARRRQTGERSRDSKSGRYVSGRLEMLALLVDSSTIRGTKFLGVSNRTQGEILDFIVTFAKKRAAAGRTR